MIEIAPLGRRIGYPASDKAWRAHLDERNNQLRQRYAALYGDADYGKADKR